MLRPLLFLSALGIAASPAVAGSYTARPVAPVAAKRIVARDIVWNCGPTACQGATEESRPLVLCQSLVKRTGRLESFATNGRAFSAAELERCNSAAAGAAAAEVAGAN